MTVSGQLSPEVMNVYAYFEFREKVKEFIQAAFGLVTLVLLVSVLITGLALIGGDPKSESKPEKQAAITKKKEVKPSPKVTDKVSSKKYVKPKPSVKPAAKKPVPVPKVYGVTCNYGDTTAVGFGQVNKAVVEAEIKRVFGSKWRLARAVFMAESGLRSNACSHTDDWGVAQVNHRWHPQYTKAQLLDYRTNIRAAFLISSGGTNFNPWYTFKDGLHLKFL